MSTRISHRRLSKLPGFSSYFLIDTGNGVMSSVGVFETSAQANESTRLASEWVRDQKLEEILQNPPKVTDGEIIVHKTNGRSRRKDPDFVAGKARSLRAFPGARGGTS